MIKRKIFNSDISGKFPKADNRWIDLITYIGNKIRHAPLVIVHIDNVHQLIPDNINKVYILSKPVQYNINLCDWLSESSNVCIPDLKNYEYGIVNLEVYRKNNKSIESQIVKIIRDTEKYYIIKLLKTKQLTYASNPSWKSIYAMLDKVSSTISSIYLTHPYIEYELINPNYNSYTLSDSKNKWYSYEPSECIICLDHYSIYYGECEHPHLIACEQCKDKLSECPICNNNNILMMSKVKILKNI